jgi:hypothetical protein
VADDSASTSSTDDEAPEGVSSHPEQQPNDHSAPAPGAEPVDPESPGASALGLVDGDAVEPNEPG